MRPIALLARASLLRAPARTLVRIAVLTLAAALLGGVIIFVGNSLRTMSASALRSVPLDLQGPVSSYGAALAAARGVASQAGVIEASPAATAPLAGSSHTGSAGTTSAGAGAVLAVGPGYLRHIHTFRLLEGSLRPGGVVLDQQMAATLQARVGDSIALSPTRSGSQHYTVTGVAIVTAGDKLFQPLSPQLGPAPSSPPANIAIMPLATFARTYAARLPHVAPASPVAASQPGSMTGVHWQVQAQLDPTPLSHGSPAGSLARATSTRNRIERSLPGQIQFVDNLSDSLNTAAGDALYAETLYIMLALPGALVSLGLAYLAALGTAERDRRDIGLLRARGAGRHHLLAIAAFESALLGVGAGVLGAALAYAAVTTIVPGGAHLDATRAAITVSVCIALATAGAAAARVGATARVVAEPVTEARRATRRMRRPLWQRLYLDVVALAVSGLIYWLTASTGFSAVVNPDSNPTLSLSVYMFFAPALLWLGATLLLVRLRGRALAFLGRRQSNAERVPLRHFLLTSAARRGAAINRGLVIAGLLLAFGVQLGLFTATYDRQTSVDAQLTLGADVMVTAPPAAVASDHLVSRVASLPGVAATSALDHSYAYIGPDLQDTYGIDARTIGRATSLRDSYFLGTGAAETMARLARVRDGILVSKETITDYSLRRGDLLELRVLDRHSGRFRVVAFHVVGVVQEFPSAPKDSFMVANLGYLESASNGPGPNVVFAKASTDPSAVARRVAAAARADGTQVKDIRQQTAETVSSITAVDLDGLRKIEEVFAVVLVCCAMALFVAVAVAERRREFAVMAAIGAPLRDLAAFVWSEAALVAGAALVLAGGLGFVLAEMLVAMLQHAFDPPPDALAVPWRFLGELAGAAVASAVLAIAIGARELRRLPLGEVLREQ